ncbi:MAG: FtsK/SpoIIIE domain-containing protein [Planctomycetia bacterium]|nr:FtsK/SpoIIIE domain-containing protein [Planctomycetia bacterium]
MEQLTGTYEDLQIPMFLGKDVAGKPLVADLVTMPHLLIAGCTGAGKSMCINSIITSIVMTRAPENVRLLMIDPRMVEMNQYSIIPHLIVPIVTDMKKAEEILAWAVAKMEERYLWLSRARVRYISDYNKLPYETKVRRAKPKATEKMPEQMPFIVIVVDEMADMMMTAPKEVESHIIRLAQKSRAVGIHLILATQKPIVTVITSLIKSNLPARIAFQVSSKNDSRVVLDENGAERLLGHGDMLFLLPGTSNLIRAQGTYLSDDEINRVVDSISTEEPQFEDEITQHLAGAGGGKIAEWAAKDELYISAIEIIVNERRGSISLLQRMLGIGYGRAARLIDFMEEDKIVGAFNGYTKPRDVLLSKDDWLKMKAEWDNSLKEVHQAEIEHEFMMDIPSNLPIRFSKHNLKGIDNLDRDEECYEEFNEYLEQEISSIPQSSHHSSSDSTERPHRKTRRRQKPNYEQIRPHDVVNHTQQLNDID